MKPWRSDIQGWINFLFITLIQKGLFISIQLILLQLNHYVVIIYSTVVDSDSPHLILVSVAAATACQRAPSSR